MHEERSKKVDSGSSQVPSLTLDPSKLEDKVFTKSKVSSEPPKQEPLLESEAELDKEFLRHPDCSRSEIEPKAEIDASDVAPEVSRLQKEFPKSKKQPKKTQHSFDKSTLIQSVSEHSYKLVHGSLEAAGKAQENFDQEPASILQETSHHSDMESTHTSEASLSVEVPLTRLQRLCEDLCPQWLSTMLERLNQYPAYRRLKKCLIFIARQLRKHRPTMIDFYAFLVLILGSLFLLLDFLPAYGGIFVGFSMFYFLGRYVNTFYYDDV